MKRFLKNPLLSGLPPLESLDRHIHEPARLRIMAHLSVVENADFIFLLNQTGLTRGNLSAHLTKLEAAGYISIKKEFVKRLPRTVLALTKQGRTALGDYLKQMQSFLEELHGISSAPEAVNLYIQTDRVKQMQYNPYIHQGVHWSPPADPRLDMQLYSVWRV